eukprot:6346960-Karenia_brevis.AAC.1
MSSRGIMPGCSGTSSGGVASRGIGPSSGKLNPRRNPSAGSCPAARGFSISAYKSPRAGSCPAAGGDAPSRRLARDHARLQAQV